MATPVPSHTPSKHPPASSPAPRSVPATGGSNMLSYDSPAVLSMLLEASSGMGGVGMSISMSGMGMSSLSMTTNAAGLPDEAEIKSRLEEMRVILAKRPSRISERGLLDHCELMDIPYEKDPNAAGIWLLLIGDEAVCEVTWHDDVISKVNLQTRLDEERPELQFGATASQILYQDFTPLHGQHIITSSLNRALKSLQTLLTLAQLGASQPGGVSCYNAIAGVYTSLRKLFEHEKQAILATRQPNERFKSYRAEREVLCKKSGRPRLNGGLCVGLSLDYWMEKRFITSHLKRKADVSQGEKGKEKADVDENDDDENEDDPTSDVYSLAIECESFPSTLYTPIRISNDWISDEIEKAADVNDADASIDNIIHDTPVVDWLDPKPTYLETPAAAETTDLATAPGQLPNVRFIAKFSPPLVVPLTVFMQLCQLVGNEARTDEFQATTFVGLALRPGEPDPGKAPTAGAQTHQIRSSHKVLYVDLDNHQGYRKHDMTLSIPKLEYSRTLETLPFSHPKQLIEILPVLRQYAATTSILKGAFFEEAETSWTRHQTVAGASSARMKALPQPADDVDSHFVDIDLSYSPPAPCIIIDIPHPSIKGPLPANTDALLTDLLSNTSPLAPAINVAVSIHANGEVVVGEQNMITPAGPLALADKVDMDDTERTGKRIKRLGQALDICSDIGIWGEWLRREAIRMERDNEA